MAAQPGIGSGGEAGGEHVLIEYFQDCQHTARVGREGLRQHTDAQFADREGGVRVRVFRSLRTCDGKIPSADE